MSLLKRLESDTSLAGFAGQFVPLKLVSSNNQEWASWKQKYKYEGNSIPILFVIRADGEQLYGQSGSLPGEALPAMLAAAMQQTGRIINEEEYNLLVASTRDARAAILEGELAEAVRAISPIAGIGVPGNLGSFALPAIEADELVAEISVEATSLITSAELELEDPETAFDALVTIAEAELLFESFPQISSRLQDLAKEIRKNKLHRGSLKPAGAVARARELARSAKPRDRRLAESSYTSIIRRFPDSPAMEIARKELAALNPDAEVELGEPAIDQPSEQPSDTREKPAEPLRNWSDASGQFSIDAKLIEVVDGQVKLEKSDGSTVEVPLDHLSESDRNYLRERKM